MTGAPPPLIYYPQYCFHLSPTLNKWCPLRAANVQALTTRDEFGGQNVYFHLNHPIKWVRIVGVVVACDEYYGRQVYTVDDGSGMTTECVTKKDAGGGEGPGPGPGPGPGKPAGTNADVAAEPDSTLLPGHVVGVKGELRPFRDLLQVQIVQIVRLRATEDEVRFWSKAQAFAAAVLVRPWVLEERVLQQCREAAERSEAGRPVAKKKKTSRVGRPNQGTASSAAGLPPPKKSVLGPSPPPQKAPKKWKLVSDPAAPVSRPAPPSPPRLPLPPPKRWILGPRTAAVSATSLPQKRQRLEPEQQES